MNLYLSSSENKAFSQVRSVSNYSIQEFKSGDASKIGYVVDVDVPVSGQEFGFGGQDINRLYLVPRHVENLSNKLTKFPISVYVSIPKSETTLPSSTEELQNIAWATLYDNREDAESNK